MLLIKALSTIVFPLNQCTPEITVIRIEITKAATIETINSIGTREDLILGNHNTLPKEGRLQNYN